jgi:hypothetical protein
MPMIFCWYKWQLTFFREMGIGRISPVDENDPFSSMRLVFHLGLGG